MKVFEIDKASLCIRKTNTLNFSLLPPYLEQSSAIQFLHTKFLLCIKNRNKSKGKSLISSFTQYCSCCLYHYFQSLALFLFVFLIINSLNNSVKRYSLYQSVQRYRHHLPDIKVLASTTIRATFNKISV